MKVLYGAGPVLALAAVLSCFSDRSATMGPIEGECTIPAGAFGPNRAVVIIRSFTFLADTVRIRSGGTVTWVNCEDPGVPAHTSTATAGVWDSPDLLPGASFAHTFTTTGTFGYFCEPHPFMRGAVVVE